MNFSSAGSGDPDGTIADYLWDFGDGTTATTANPSHTYTVPGPFVAMLTVTDDGGAQTTQTVLVKADAPNALPIAVASAIPVGDPLSLNVNFYADGSYDPDGFLGNLEWSFSDGGTTFGSPAYYSFESPGTYTAMLTVYDRLGATATTNLTIHVGTGGPSPSATPTSTPTATPATVTITGTVTYGNAIPPTTRFVSTVLVSGGGSVAVSTTTGFPDGTYLLSGFGAGGYIITPSKMGGVNGSITSFDAARIAQHTSGGNPLTGNQLVVADVSGNGTISSFDAGQVARYVVGSPPFGTAGNWKFSPDSNTHAAVNASISGEDYSALLMGEVSGNWNNTGARPADGRQKAKAESSGSEGCITVELPTFITVDKEIVVPVTVEGIADKGVISYEFDLRYDPSVIQPLVNPVDVAGTVSRGLFTVANPFEPGLLRVVVYGPMPIDENGLLLNLRFTAVGASGAASALRFERIMFNEGDPGTKTTDGHVLLTIGRERK